jgi:PAS domain-containing protein
LRFVWQIDAANRFTLGTEEFAKMLGPKTMAVLGRSWADVAAELKLDPQGAVANALAARGTWSGIVVPWPIWGEDQPLPIEMSGLPIFGRDREFAGYRGFGICRDVDRLAALEQRRAQATSAPADVKAEARAENVQAFPTDEPPALSAGERSAFEELARELSARLKGASGKSTAAPATANVARAPAAPVRRTVRGGDAARDVHEGRPILDRMPVGILVYRLNTLLYANRAFLDWTGYPSLEALSEAG